MFQLAPRKVRRRKKRIIFGSSKNNLMALIKFTEIKFIMFFLIKWLIFKLKKDR